jgi:hypothetical protein
MILFYNINIPIAYELEYINALVMHTRRTAQRISFQILSIPQQHHGDMQSVLSNINEKGILGRCNI